MRPYFIKSKFINLLKCRWDKVIAHKLVISFIVSRFTTNCDMVNILYHLNIKIYKNLPSLNISHVLFAQSYIYFTF